MSAVQIKKLDSLTGHQGSVYNLQETGEVGIILSSAADGMIVQWDLRQPEEGVVVAKLPNSVYAIHVVKETGLVLAGHNYEGIHVLDWKSRKEVSSIQLTKAAIFDIKSWKSHAFVATGEGSVIVLDHEHMTIVTTLQHSSANVRSIAISPAREELAVGYSDHFIRIFDLRDYHLKKEWKAHQNSVFTVTYDDAQKILLSGSRDAHLKAWDTTLDYTLKEDVAAHLYAINHLAYSPDHKHFVTCSLDKSVKVWDADRLTLLKVIDKARHAGHSSSVNRLLWSSFHNRLISAGDDRMISVWDVIF